LKKIWKELNNEIVRQNELLENLKDNHKINLSNLQARTRKLLFFCIEIFLQLYQKERKIKHENGYFKTEIKFEF